MNIFFIPFLLGVIVYKGECILRTWPADTEAIVGQAVQLQCSSMQPYFVIWEHERHRDHAKESVSFGEDVVPPYENRFRIIHDKGMGKYALEIKSVQLEDSGKFYCVDMEGQGERREAELTVLERPPQCFCKESVTQSGCSSSKLENIQIHCQVAYTGNKAPELLCPNVTGFVGLETESISTGVSIVSYVMNSSVDPQSLNSNYTCYTKVSRVPSPSFTANLTIVHPVQKKEQLTISDPVVVTCKLNSSRDCDYQWITSSGTVAWGQNLTISESGVYRCIAHCLSGGRNCTIEPTEVDVVFMQPETAFSTIAIGFIVGLVIVFIIAVIIFIIKRQKSSKEWRTDKWKREEKRENYDMVATTSC